MITFKRGLTRIRVTHVLTVNELEGLLIAAHNPTTFGDLHELSRHQIEALIRRQLEVNPEKRHWWSDDYMNPDEGEPDYEAVNTWAQNQLAKLAG